MQRSQFSRKILLLFLLVPALVFPIVSASSAETYADPFAIPPGLEKAVNFWKSIFTRYDSSQIIFFDPESFHIYDVMTVPEHAKVQRVTRFWTRQIQREHGLGSERVRFQRGMADHFADGIKRSGRYMPHMREVFAEEGLPKELTYLPLVESSFRMDARSFVGAVGIWQFMPGTGRRFLRVTRDLDERKDPWDATRAAARLLRENYEALGTWPLAVTAYNHGQAGIARAVRAVGSTDIVSIIDKYQSPSFQFASKNFYAEFLAAVHIMRELDRHFPDLDIDPPLEVEEIALKKYVPVAALVRHSGVSRAELLEWNPALSNRARWMPKGYRLKVSPENEDLVRASLGEIPEMRWIPHQVTRGESLWKIALRYGTTVQDIQMVNRLKNVRRLRIGQELKIPYLKGHVSRHSSKVRTAGRHRDTWKYHRVRRGESLWVIARRYRVSVARLRRVNGISKAEKIQPGDRLKIRKNES